MAFDDKGIPLVGGKIYTYIAGTTTAKATYSDKDLTVANTNPVVLDRRGEAVIYGAGSYKFVLKDTDLNTIWTMDNLNLSIESYCFYPDPSEADHAATSTGGSIKDILTALGTSKKAEIVLLHNGVANTTTYTIKQNADWSAYTNVTFKIMPGAKFSGAFTVNIPNIEAGQYQIFDSTLGTVTFSGSIKAVYPQWWGATGDGTTDDTIAIQHAVAASTNRNLIFISPPSKYKITSTIDLPSGGRVIGEGLTNIYQASANTTTFVPGNNTEIAGFKFTGTGVLNVPGRAAIEGDPSALGSISEHVFIHNNVFDSTLSVCGVGGNNCVDWRIENNDFTLGSESEHAIYISGGGNRVHIVGNRIQKTGTSSATSIRGVGIKGSQNIWVNENIITGDGFDGYGIISSDVSSSNISIKNNRIYDLGNEAVAIRAGSASIDSNIYIEGNNIDQTTSTNTGIYIENASYVKVAGNFIKSAHTGIEVDHLDATDIMVNNNIIVDSTHTGIYRRSGARFNCINNVTIGSTQAYGIWDDGGNAAAMYKGNISKGAKLKNIFIDSLAYVSDNEGQSTGGKSILYKEATGTSTAATTFNIATQIPQGARIVGCQLRVDTALSNNFDAAYNTGATQTIATAALKELNTKVNTLFDTNIATDITSATTDITITHNGVGDFTAGGVVRAIVYYEALFTMDDI